jgi:hypothetical protein
VLVSFDVGRIDDGCLAVGVLSEALQNSVEHLELVPARELRMDGLPGAEALGKISPRNARLGDVKYCVHERAIGELGWPSAATAFARQQGLDSRPLLIGQLVSSHLQT